MGFLQPLALFGLAASAIPLLLHLWRRRLPPVVEFPAVRYLAETEREHSRRLKLHNLLLLLLRTCLILAIVLGMARPFVRVKSARGGGSHEPTAVAVVLDNSLSSGAVRDGVPTLHLLKDLAKDVLFELTAADHLWLVMADGLPRRMAGAEARTVVDSLGPWPVRLDLGEAVTQAVAVVADDPLPAHEIHILSDLQRSALGSAPIGQDVRLLAVPLPGDPPANRGIGPVSVLPARWGRDGGTVTIETVGDADLGPSPVTVSLGERARARGVVRAGEGVELRLTPSASGWLSGRVELRADELRADDRATFAVRVAPPARVTVAPGVGKFVVEAVAVLKQGGRLLEGAEVAIAGAPGSGATVVLPPEEPAQIGALNRALAGRDIPWRYESGGLAGLVSSGALPMVNGVEVARRYRLIPTGGASNVLASVDGDPWLVHSGELILLGSRLEEEWTDLPVRSTFVVFLDHLLNRAARGDVVRLTAAPAAPVVIPDQATALVSDNGRRPLEPGAPIRAPRALGLYYLLAGSDTIGTLAVNPDPRESQLERASVRDLRAAFGRAAELVSAKNYAEVRFTGTHSAELSTALLLVALALATVEFFVARVTRGRAVSRLGG